MYKIPLKHNPSNMGGFTLVELAIVLMIIGLLIGGVLRGQELMQNARVTTTVQQVHAYSGATTTFMDQYGAMPGDMGNATNRIAGCTTDSYCANGNRDGVIGVLVPGQAAAENQPWYNIDPSISSENTQFWKHLALAHLISGVNSGANAPEFGRSHPVSKLNGGFFVRQTNMAAAGPYPAWTGTILVMRNDIDGLWQCGGGADLTSACAISPLRAAQIDRKMDDGMANNGDARAVSANWTNGCGIPNNGTQNASGYDETHSDAACDMMFHIF